MTSGRREPNCTICWLMGPGYPGERCILAPARDCPRLRRMGSRWNPGCPRRPLKAGRLGCFEPSLAFAKEQPGEGDADRRPRRRRGRPRVADPRRHVRARRLLGAELPRVQGRAARRADLGVPALGRDAPIHRRYKVRECDVLVVVSPSPPSPQAARRRQARRAGRPQPRDAVPARRPVRRRARAGLADRARQRRPLRRRAGRWATWPCSAPA